MVYIYFHVLASVDKGPHGFPGPGRPLASLSSLAGDSPPASKRTKIPRKSKAVRCEAVLREQKCPQTMKSPQRILCVFSRALRKYEGISAPPNRVCPCQSTQPFPIKTLCILQIPAGRLYAALPLFREKRYNRLYRGIPSKILCPLSRHDMKGDIYREVLFMPKLSRKIPAFLLAMIMLLSCVQPALAEDDGVSGAKYRPTPLQFHRY